MLNAIKVALGRQCFAVRELRDRMAHLVEAGKSVQQHRRAVLQNYSERLHSRLQELLGYNIYPPFVGYVDGSHPRKVLRAAE